MMSFNDLLIYLAVTVASILCGMAISVWRMHRQEVVQAHRRRHRSSSHRSDHRAEPIVASGRLASDCFDADPAKARTTTA